MKAKGRLRGIGQAFLVCFSLFLLFPSTGVAAAEPGPWSAFVYGGKWTDNRWNEIVRGQTEMRRSYVWAAGAARNLYNFGDFFSVEGELNVAKNSGRQHHFEVNSAVVLRWQAFPWSQYVATSLAYGLGISYALERPAIEDEPDRRASRSLVFMPTELTLGPPEADWTMLLRIHHRSGAFGVIDDAGGSNFISLGVRFQL